MPYAGLPHAGLPLSARVFPTNGQSTMVVHDQNCGWNFLLPRLFLFSLQPFLALHALVKSSSPPREHVRSRPQLSYVR